LDLVIDILGWGGSLFLVVTYGLNSYQVIKSESLLFYSLNIIGGILLTFYSVNKTAYANPFINVVWVAIAIPAAIRLVKKQWHSE
jgi:hypothetical protein